MGNYSLEKVQTIWRVSSFQDFKDWFDESPHQRTVAWSKIDVLRERLEGSNEQIKDPIAFLHDLYFDKQLSFRKILEHPRVDKLYSVKWLRNLFVESFGWEVRTNTQRTWEHVRVASERVAEGVEKFEKQVWQLLWGRKQERIFKMDEYKTKKYRIGKALYILKTLWWIDKNMLFSISKKWWLWARVLANALNSQLRKILDEFPDIPVDFDDLMLRPQSIERWFTYKENQQS